MPTNDSSSADVQTHRVARILSEITVAPVVCEMSLSETFFSLDSPTPQDNLFVHLSQESTPEKVKNTSVVTFETALSISMSNISPHYGASLESFCQARFDLLSTCHVSLSCLPI